MELNKVKRDNGMNSLELVLRGKKYETFSVKANKGTVAVRYLFLLTPAKKIKIAFAYATEKGDFWRDKNQKNEFIKFQKNRIILGKLSVSW